MKRIGSIFMVVVLCFMLLPVTVFAALPLGITVRDGVTYIDNIKTSGATESAKSHLKAWYDASIGGESAKYYQGVALTIAGGKYLYFYLFPKGSNLNYSWCDPRGASIFYITFSYNSESSSYDYTSFSSFSSILAYASSNASPKLIIPPTGISFPSDYYVPEITSSVKLYDDAGLFDAKPEPEYKLTIDYLHSDGSKAAESYVQSIKEGESFNITTPELLDYTPTLSAVSGVMGSSDLHYTVTFAANPKPTPTPTPIPTPVPTPLPTMTPLPPEYQKYVAVSDDTLLKSKDMLYSSIGSITTVALHSFLILSGIFLIFSLTRYFMQ